ncbi:ChbG/HpnK family deacetylase [Flagellimonas myxillae]|uniref:ChbG/HpnK family deacetylase n=1 Tax=Flagellimonas myxillae TaxID=2942214 RepID=UPI00201EED59|nr:ChbG/HpnK family deacetylase [Muricauda myxillae]MCL6268070.1 ChbG/HpnK family deacetylase [Muricauda myxillae]
MAKLIINADDFGLSKKFNQTIIKLLEERKITSTTVMVDRISDYQEVQVQHLKYLMRDSEISVGLHVEFTYDRHLEQVKNQFEKFSRIFDQTPSHLDIHKEHLHTNYHEVVAGFCKEQQLPFRNHGTVYDGVSTTCKKYFFGTLDSFNPIDAWLRDLEPAQYSELVFHPGTYDPVCPSSLNKERERDIEHIQRIFENMETYQINPVSFNQLVQNNLKPRNCSQG